MLQEEIMFQKREETVSNVEEKNVCEEKCKRGGGPKLGSGRDERGEE